jgi:hypothetical protein
MIDKLSKYYTRPLNASYVQFAVNTSYSSNLHVERKMGNTVTWETEGQSTNKTLEIRPR